MIVEVVTRSPCLIGMSPTTPAWGASTRSYCSSTWPSRTCASSACSRASAVRCEFWACSNSWRLIAPAPTSASRRLTCWRRSWASASMPARLASVLRTVARCFSALIWTSGAPARTRSPALTKIRVTMPSTSGWTVVERSERMVAMKSEVCSMGFSCSVKSDTPVGGGAPPAGPAPWAGRSPPQAAASRHAVPSSAGRTRGWKLRCMRCPYRVATCRAR